MLSPPPEFVKDPSVVRSLELLDTHADALREVARRLGKAGVRWAVSGSAGHRLQGVPLEVHDLDIQTDERGAWTADESLADVAVQRLSHWESTTMSSLFGRYRVAGIDVEIIGGIRHRASQESPWDEPVQLSGPAVLWVQAHGMRLAVMSLSHEVLAYQNMGRHDRARLLARHLDR
jgi:hypothetical protein